MAEELKVPAATLAEVRDRLGAGRSALEESASSAPRTVDGGEVTALLTGMLSRVLDNAAAVSEALGAVSSQVAEAGTAFWETDAEVAATYDASGGVDGR